MAETVSLADIERQIRVNPDQMAGDILPDGSFAKHAYMNASDAHLAKTAPEQADSSECSEWGLSAEEWSEQMKAVARARAHDAKLDLLKQGITPSG